MVSHTSVIKCWFPGEGSAGSLEDGQTSLLPLGTTRPAGQSPNMGKPSKMRWGRQAEVQSKQAGGLGVKEGDRQERQEPQG